MNRIGLLVVVIASMVWCGSRAFAQADEPPGDAGAATTAEAPAGHEAAAGEGTVHESTAPDAGPIVPDTSHRWPVPLLLIIGCMFLAAAVIGPIVRAQAPPEMPPTHSHDEPPGASHHHGESGTINPVPEDVAKLEQDDAGHGHGHH
jgi:hypothetical protein